MTEKNADLVNTLARYLDAGGNYDQTSRALSIHRSTLRYRLGRIREISGQTAGVEHASEPSSCNKSLRDDGDANPDK